MLIGSFFALIMQEKHANIFLVEQKNVIRQTIKDI